MFTAGFQVAASPAQTRRVAAPR